MKFIFDKTVDEKVTQAQIIAAFPLDPHTTVRDVLTALVAARLVISYRGTGGGYLLVLPPHQITLYSVVAAVEQGIPMSRASEPGGIERMLIKALSGVTLSSFVNESGEPPLILE